MRAFIFCICLLIFNVKSFGNKDSLAYSKISQQLPKVAAVNHDSAVRLAFKGLQIAQKSGIPNLMCSANMNYGIMMKVVSKLDSSIYYYYEAQTIAKNSKDTQMLLSIEINLGNLYSTINEDDKAIDCMENALHLANQLNDKNPLPFIYNNLGLIFSKNKEYNRAEKYYLKAIELNQLSNDSVNLARNFANYAEILVKMEKFKESQLYFHKALRINYELKNPNGISFNYKGIGELLMAKNDLNAALQAFEKSNIYADSSGSSSSKLEALKYLHSVNAQLGSWKLAYAYLIQHNRLTEEMHLDEKTKIIAELEEQYKNLEKQSKIEVLETDKQINQFKLSQRQTWIYLLLFSLAFIIALFIIFMQRNRNRYQKNKINQDILLAKIRTQELNAISEILKSREDERRKLSYNLHDSIGVMLATAKLHLEKGMKETTDMQMQNESVKKSYELIDHASEEARRIAQELISPVLEKFGLILALKDLSDSINETGQINVWYEVNEKLEFSLKQEENLYRIIQELLNNTIKHAKANNISIALEDTAESIILKFKDDGIGISENSMNTSTANGLGWKSIYSRVQQLNGHIKCEKQTKGLLVQVLIPRVK